MLRSLPFVPMGQQQHEAARLVPLGFGRNQELIDDDLGAVGKVTELCFPQDECQRIGNAVAELETHRGVLAQEAVNHFELCLIRAEVLERDIALSRLEVGELKVPLREGSTRYVFPRQANGCAVQNEAS